MNHSFILDFYQGFIAQCKPIESERMALYGVGGTLEQRLVLDFLFSFHCANTSGFEDKMQEVGGSILHGINSQTIDEVMIELFGVSDNLFQLASDIYDQNVDNLCYQGYFRKFAKRFDKHYPYAKEYLWIALNNLKDGNGKACLVKSPSHEKTDVLVFLSGVDDKLINVLQRLVDSVNNNVNIDSLIDFISNEQ